MDGHHCSDEETGCYSDMCSCDDPCCRNECDCDIEEEYSYYG